MAGSEKGYYICKTYEERVVLDTAIMNLYKRIDSMKCSSFYAVDRLGFDRFKEKVELTAESLGIKVCVRFGKYDLTCTTW